MSPWKLLQVAGELTADDGQELIPDRQTKIETMLAQVLEENRELRRRLESPTFVAASGSGDVNRVQCRPEGAEGFNVHMAAPSPQWGLPDSGLGWSSGAMSFRGQGEGFSGGPCSLWLGQVLSSFQGPVLNQERSLRDLPDVPDPPGLYAPSAPGFQRPRFL